MKDRLRAGRRRVFNHAAPTQSTERLRTARPRAELRKGRTDWYRIKNLVDQPDTAAVYIYDEIGYWGTSAQAFVRDLMAVRVSNLHVHINSPGGDVFDGIAIYNAIRNHPATVTVYIDGLAASAASFIAMAGDKVICARNAQMMIHEAAGICIGNSAEMAEMAALLDKCSDNIADIYLQKAGGSVEAWREAMRVETWYSADEALTAGLVDEVDGADPAEDDPAMANTWDLSIFNYQGREAAPAPDAASVSVAGAEGQTPTPASSEPPAEPVAPEPTAVEPVVETAADSPTDDAPELEPEPVVASTEPPVSEPDQWADLTASLLTPAVSTADAVFDALKGSLLR